MTRIAAIVTALCLSGFAAATQPMLPRCTAALDGQVSEGGCSCDYDRGGQLTGRSPGWRWKCDLLRGPGPVAAVPPAGLPAPGLPPGFVYAPQRTQNNTTTGSSSGTTTGTTGTGTPGTGTTGGMGSTGRGRTALPGSATASADDAMNY